MTEAVAIRPRTKEERCAYVAGYADAVNDIAKHGVEFGGKQVRLMVETEAAFDREGEGQ